MLLLASARRTRALFDDITVLPVVLLDAIDAAGAAGVAAVAELTGRSQRTVTRRVAALVRQGLVRVDVDAADVRRSGAERGLAAPLLRHLAGIVDGLF